jgi:hypothetical protein
MTAITFFAGYAVSFYCTTINVDYSENHIETYKNVTVKYDPEFNQFTVIDKHGNEKIYGGIK